MLSLEERGGGHCELWEWGQDAEITKKLNKYFNIGDEAKKLFANLCRKMR